MFPSSSVLFILKRGRVTPNTRTFSTTLPRFRKAILRRSPRVSRGDADAPPVAGKVRIQRTFDIEESLPPLSLLKTANSSGALEVEPQDALEFLRQYQRLSKKDSTLEQTLCAEHHITPSTVHLLALILARCSSNAQLSLAKSLMLSASNLGEAAATFTVIAASLQSGSLQQYQPQLYRLAQLAKKHDPQAMTLLGKVLLTQSKEKEALDWFQRVTRQLSEYPDFEGAGEAFVNEGRLLLKYGKKENAVAAFRKAALELDDPSAYFYLAQLQEPGSPTQEIYLLKAASSGVVEAQHNLGAIELAKAEFKAESTPGNRANLDFGMAIEWFTVAAQSGSGLSMLNLASIYKAQGDPASGLLWLEAAEDIPEVFEQARALRSNW